MKPFKEYPDEWQAFIRLAREQPDDDQPMLLAADWLEDHRCFEEAKFIRVQVDNPNRYVSVGVKRLFRGRWTWGVVAARMNNWMKWKSPAMRMSHPLGDLSTSYAGDVRVVIRRGAIRRIVCYPGFWLAHGESIMRLWPIHCVTLHQFRDSGTVRRREVTRAIFDKMPGWEGSGESHDYASRADAEAAISEGAIRFALGLPKRTPRQLGELATDGMDGLGSLGYFFRDSGNSG